MNDKLTLLAAKIGGSHLAKLNKFTPDIAFAAGVAGVAAGSVLLYKAAKSKKTDEPIKDTAKRLAPPVAITGASVGLMIGAYLIQRKRVAALIAAAGITEEVARKYKKAVDGVLDEKDSEDESDDVSINGYSPYARFFGLKSVNWSASAQANQLFLRCQQNYLNDLLNARGHVFLNEVYDHLGYPRTKAGAVTGWSLKNPNGDHYITMGFDAQDKPNAVSFMHGDDNEVILDFNVDGVILNYI